MRLLIINPNTSEAVTRRIAATARRHARPGTEIIATTAPFGVPFIQTPADSERAAEAVEAAAAAHAGQVDAAVVAAFSDPGLAAARTRLRVPVTGIARSALAVARAEGGPTAIVTAGPALEPALRALVAAAGCTDLVAAIRFVTVPAGNADRLADTHAEAFLAACRQAIAEDGAASIILGGGPMAGLAETLARAAGVPVLDGVACAVGLAELLVPG